MKAWKAIAGALLTGLAGGGCHVESLEVSYAHDGRPPAYYDEYAMRALTREVVVTDAYGWPIDGARVGLWIPDSETLARGHTGFEGSVAFTFTAAPHTLFYLSVQAPGFLPVAIEDRSGRAPHRTYLVDLICDAH